MFLVFFYRYYGRVDRGAERVEGSVDGESVRFTFEYLMRTSRIQKEAGVHFAQVVQDLALSRFSMLSARDRGLWSCQLAACVHSNIFFIPLYNRLGYDKF